jgi:monofunctional biosynthetic peptidoglycan transglycosylase
MKKAFYKALLLGALLSGGFYFYHSLPEVDTLKSANPRTSALMELRDREYRRQGLRLPRRHIWVSYGAISEHLKRSVLLGEDASFFRHEGVDFAELEKAIWKDIETRSFKRGGSTITMQLARNLYLSPSKNPFRKLKEIIIAWRLERALSKRRIFEIYLNVVEWGRNIYGAEAASRHYFGKSAASLTVPEAATLAALLPSPRGPALKGIVFRRNVILQRLAAIGYIRGDEYSRARAVRPFARRSE